MGFSVLSVSDPEFAARRHGVFTPDTADTLGGAQVGSWLNGSALRKAGRRPALRLKLIGLRFPGASRFMGNCFCAGIMRLRLCLSGRKARLFRAVAVDFGIELDGTAQIQAWKAPPEVRRIPS